MISNFFLGPRQVAYVGLTEEEAKAKGVDVKVGKFLFLANSRARAVGDTDGMVSDNDGFYLSSSYMRPPVCKRSCRVLGTRH